jgi:hypothetical protein
MIFVFSHNPEKIEMIFLISAEYSLKTNPEEINMTSIAELMADHQALKLQTNEQSEVITRQMAEIAELNAQLAELKKQIPKHRCPQDECLIPWSGADFTYYAAIDDKNEHDLTIWKVPRHLSDIKSANTDYHGVVEQAFADEKFGERHERVDYFIVREMKMADLTKRKIQVEE